MQVKQLQYNKDTKEYTVNFEDKYTHTEFTKVYIRLPLWIRRWRWIHRSTKLTRENTIVWSNDYFVYH